MITKWLSVVSGSMKANIDRFIIALRNRRELAGELKKVARSAAPILSILFLLTFPIVAGGLLALYLNGFFAWPDFSRVQDRRETSMLYAEDGEVLREYCTYCREMAALDEMGPFPKLAIVAEDKTFEGRLTQIGRAHV